MVYILFNSLDCTIDVVYMELLVFVNDDSFILAGRLCHSFVVHCHAIFQNKLCQYKSAFMMEYFRASLLKVCDECQTKVWASSRLVGLAHSIHYTAASS